MAEQAAILVVDDDREIVGAITAALEKEGYRVLRAYDGMEALDKALDPDLRLILMDVMMPRLDGLSAVLRIRERRNLPVILLSAKSEESDKVLGLSMGADDYMTKPFSARELLLRISAILKRCSTLASEEAEVLRSGGLVLDLTARRVEVDGRQINLTPREFDLLTVLMSHPDVAFSRKRLLDIIWGGELSTDTRTLDTHIQHIRCAIVPYSDRIVTLRGVGYRFEKE